jgi:hypothetical protein
MEQLMQMKRAVVIAEGNEGEFWKKIHPPEPFFDGWVNQYSVAAVWHCECSTRSCGGVWERSISMTGLLQDFRFAIRSLTKDRRFALLAILALAMGIGSATVIFSAIYGVILNTFPFRDADQVTSFGIQDLTNPGNGRRESLSLPEFLDYREQSHAFADISGEYGGFGSTPLLYTVGDSSFEFSADWST